MLTRLITVTTRGMQRSRCRDCRQPILWVTTQSRPRHPAKRLPFNLPRPFPLRTERNEETGVEFEVWPAIALHFRTCQAGRREARAWFPSTRTEVRA